MVVIITYIFGLVRKTCFLRGCILNFGVHFREKSLILPCPLRLLVSTENKIIVRVLEVAYEIIMNICEKSDSVPFTFYLKAFHEHVYFILCSVLTYDFDKCLQEATFLFHFSFYKISKSTFVFENNWEYSLKTTWQRFINILWWIRLKISLWI